MAQDEFDGGLLGTGTDWETTTNWLGDTLPSDSSDVIIPDDILVYNVEINSEVIVNNLTLNDNNLTINAGGSLIVYGTLNLGVSSDLTTNNNVRLMNGASIIQSTLASINGEVILKRDGTTEDAVYNYWSSPVDNETYRDVFLSFPGADVDSNDLYYFDHTVQNSDTTGSNSGWTLINPDDTIPVMRGFAATGIEYDTGTATRTFQGIPHNGTLSLDFTIDSLVNGYYFVLTGNPYPSAIDLNLFLTENASISEVYLWDDDDGDNLRSDYITANTLGATGGNSGVTDVDYIASAQGYFVDAAALGLGAVSIIYNNTMRVSANNSQFFRQGTDTERLYLNLETLDKKYGNQTLVGFHPLATDGKDPDLDSRKIDGNPYVALYSFLLADPGDRYAIQALSAFKDSVHLPLGLNTGISETYTISLLHRNLGANTMVYLKDKSTGLKTNLLNEPYQVTLNAGTYDNRYELIVYRNRLPVGLLEQEKSEFLYQRGNHVLIADNNQGVYQLEVLDLLGRRVVFLPHLASDTEVNLSGLKKGVYLVRAIDIKDARKTLILKMFVE